MLDNWSNLSNNRDIIQEGNIYNSKYGTVRVERIRYDWVTFRIIDCDNRCFNMTKEVPAYHFILLIDNTKKPVKSIIKYKKKEG